MTDVPSKTIGDLVKNAAPLPWEWEWVSANASGGGHIYLTDTNGRKIAAIWGPSEQKQATADLIIAVVNGLTT